jgi:phage tail P2-like protein
MVDIAQIRLIDLVPPSIKDDPAIQTAAVVLDTELRKITAAIPTTLLLPRLDELTEDIVDSLAWQFHVDFYEPGISLAQKRKLVKNAIETHRRKGTPHAVEEVVTAILEDAVVQEWFEYGGEPYHFRVIKINGQVTAEMYPKLKKAIDTVKNTRSWLEGVSLYREMIGTVYVGGACSSLKTVTILSAAFRAPRVAGTTYRGGTVYNLKGVEIKHA